MHSCTMRRFAPFYILLTVGVILVFPFMAGRKSQAPFAAEALGKAPSTCRLLLLGEDETSGLCDVIILATMDTREGSVCLAQIPRDTYFHYTEKDYKKINGAVSALGGAEAFCQALGEALAVDIDGYVMVDLKGIRSLVNMLGGVEINVPCDMDYDDPAQRLSIHLKKGPQTLTGEQAAQFIRFRSGYIRGDIGRIDAQKLFLAAFFQSAKALDGGDIPRLATIAMRSVRTNVGVGQGISLFRVVRAMDADKVTILTLPGEEIRSSRSGAWYYVLSKKGITAVLSDQFGVEDASLVDPAHLFSEQDRADFESIYRREIKPEYHTVDSLQREGVDIG